MTLKAKAGFRRSSQWESEVSGKKRKPSGKMVGKPMDVKPLAVKGRKSVKLLTSCKEAQPPTELLTKPLFKNEVICELVAKEETKCVVHTLEQLPHR